MQFCSMIGRVFILNARHAEQEHIIIEIKCHFGNQTERRVKLLGDPSGVTLSYFGPPVTGLNCLEKTKCSLSDTQWP